MLLSTLLRHLVRRGIEIDEIAAADVDGTDAQSRRAASVKGSFIRCFVEEGIEPGRSAALGSSTTPG